MIPHDQEEHIFQPRSSQDYQSYFDKICSSLRQFKSTARFVLQPYVNPKGTFMLFQLEEFIEPSVTERQTPSYGQNKLWSEDVSIVDCLRIAFCEVYTAYRSEVD